MKKNGYTIAEVLITLLIVGILGALTIPALVTNYNKHSYVKVLPSAISNLEKSMNQLIISELADNVYGTEAFKIYPLNAQSSNNDIKNFTNELGKTLKINKTYRTFNDCYDEKFFKGLYKTQAVKIFGFGISTKNQVIYWFEINQGNEKKLTEQEASIKNTTLRKEVAKVYIDTNGKSKPNTIGIDVFSFFLGDNGILYPTGSREYSNYKTELLNLTSQNRFLHWTSNGRYACKDGNYGTSGEGCTARLIENNYKIDY